MADLLFKDYHPNFLVAQQCVCDTYRVICDNSSVRRIAVLHLVSGPWVTRMFGGIRRYAEEQGNWKLFFVPSYIPGKQISQPKIYMLEGWKGDGILFSSNDPDELRFAKKLGIPAVNLASGLKQAEGIS